MPGWAAAVRQINGKLLAGGGLGIVVGYSWVVWRSLLGVCAPRVGSLHTFLVCGYVKTRSFDSMEFGDIVISLNIPGSNKIPWRYC